jgi:hypothetical protein
MPLGRILDAAHQIDRGPDHGEIEPVGGADIAVMDRADMQRDDDVERRLAVHRRVIGKAGDGDDRLARCGDGGLRDRFNRVGAGNRKDGEQAIADEFEDFAAMRANFGGLGMEQTLTTAATTNGYTLTDRSTWVQFRDRRNLEIVVDHDARLFNQYAVMVVNSVRHPTVKADLGMAFIEWLTSRQGQDTIPSYKVAGEQLFFPDYVEP